MSWADFLIVFACCAATMLACRVIPLFALKGKSLPQQVEAALGVPVIPVEADSGFDLVDAILGLTVELPAYRLPPEAEYYRYNP